MDIAAERARIQAMFESPQTSMEWAIKKDWLDNGSEPREWSDETVSSAYWALRVYEMGWKAALPKEAGQARELPPPAGYFGEEPRYTADQMREYARAAICATRKESK